MSKIYAITSASGRITFSDILNMGACHSDMDAIAREYGTGFVLTSANVQETLTDWAQRHPGYLSYLRDAGLVSVTEEEAGKFAYGDIFITGNDVNAFMLTRVDRQMVVLVPLKAHKASGLDVHRGNKRYAPVKVKNATAITNTEMKKICGKWYDRIDLDNPIRETISAITIRNADGRKSTFYLHDTV